jgi:hypothetical protein
VNPSRTRSNTYFFRSLLEEVKDQLAEARLKARGKMPDTGSHSTTAQAAPGDWRAKWGHLIHDESGAGSSETADSLNTVNDVIEELAPTNSILLLIGMSGVGKSPLLYQAGLSVAAGLPFLEFKVKRGRFLLFDYENTPEDSIALRQRLRRFLGIPDPVADFIVVPMKGRREKFSRSDVVAMIRDIRPLIAAIEPLIAFNPEMEREAQTARAGLDELHEVGAETGSAIWIAQHPKKENPDPKLVEPITGDFDRWCEQMRGSGELINAADVRIGMAKQKDSGRSSADGKALSLIDQAEVLIRYRRRGWDTSEPIGLMRVRDENNPRVVLGYKRLHPAYVLKNADQERVFLQLPHSPQSFGTGDAKRIYGRDDSATDAFLNKAVELGLIDKVSRGVWRRLK